jgi:hypothetical protein
MSNTLAYCPRASVKKKKVFEGRENKKKEKSWKNSKKEIFLKTRAQSFKTFFVHNLQISVIS